MSRPALKRIESFDLPPGRVIAGKYKVEAKLGAGWEGEVYRVVETRTGVHRAAKLFFPHRNKRDEAVRVYAKKLEALRDCSMVIQYHHSETFRYRGVPITFLLSEFVEGEILTHFIKRHRGKRLHHFEALHLLHTLADGIEEIHDAGEYHGDLHEDNVLVRRRGVFFDVKIVDFYNWGRPTREHYRDDVASLVRLLYDMTGGKKHYPAQPPEIKAICRGLRRDLIFRSFPTAQALREFLETFVWVS